ncbi:MAG: methionyl-tRNA formyltransferase [Planctomycetes bacterium]|nr:methionyl-tRNA formyltransferase [Planctomycetota bacterium]
MHIVFMGSPDFALPVLQNLARDYPVVGVVTQPDRPAGRGRILTPPPVKELALSLNIPVIQPNRLKEPEAFAQLQAWQPDLIVVAAFGQILRQTVLDLPPLGCVNVHASLLPRWRGAAPVQAAIISGDAATGITIMKMDAGIDTGPILAQHAVPILAEDTGETLGSRLAEVGGELLMMTLPGYLLGEIKPFNQDNSLATYAAMLKKEDGQLDFNLPAEILERRVRAFYPWPGTYMQWGTETLKILSAHVINDKDAFPQIQGVAEVKPAVGTSSGWLVFDEVQPAGKRIMPGEVFLRGARGWLSQGQ